MRIQLEAIAAGGPKRGSVSGIGRLRWQCFAAAVVVAAIALLIAIGAGAAYFAESEAGGGGEFFYFAAGRDFVCDHAARRSGRRYCRLMERSWRLRRAMKKAKFMLYVRSLASTAAQALPGTDDAIYPFWSPDSREIAFFAAGKLKKINASGGPPQDICESFSGRGGTWSKDGVIVFTSSSNQGLMKVSAAGGTPEPASKLNAATGENSHRFPYFLPDGKHFIYWSRTSRVGQSPVLYVGELSSLQGKMLMKSDSIASYASGHLLFLRGQTLMAQPFDLGKLELSGEPQPIAERIAINGASVRAMFSASDTGRLIYQTGEASAGWMLVWRDREGKQTDAVAQGGALSDSGAVA